MDAIVYGLPHKPRDPRTGEFQRLHYDYVVYVTGLGYIRSRSLHEIEYTPDEIWACHFHSAGEMEDYISLGDLRIVQAPTEIKNALQAATV